MNYVVSTCTTIFLKTHFMFCISFPKLVLEQKSDADSPSTWKTHVQSILRKPGCEAIDFAGISLKQI